MEDPTRLSPTPELVTLGRPGRNPPRRRITTRRPGLESKYGSLVRLLPPRLNEAPPNWYAGLLRVLGTQATVRETAETRKVKRSGAWTASPQWSAVALMGPTSGSVWDQTLASDLVPPTPAVIVSYHAEISNN
jgi:hypothetical protein